MLAVLSRASGQRSTTLSFCASVMVRMRSARLTRLAVRGFALRHLRFTPRALAAAIAFREVPSPGRTLVPADDARTFRVRRPASSALKMASANGLRQVLPAHTNRMENVRLTL
jgi:hypothetical protein